MCSGNIFISVTGQHIDGSIIARDRHNVCSVGAEEGILYHSVRFIDGGFFLPLPINKPADFDSIIVERPSQCVFRRG